MPIIQSCIKFMHFTSVCNYLRTCQRKKRVRVGTLRCKCTQKLYNIGYLYCILLAWFQNSSFHIFKSLRTMSHVFYVLPNHQIRNLLQHHKFIKVHIINIIKYLLSLILFFPFLRLFNM